MRVGIYARVSTHDQQTLPMQLGKMKEYIEHRGWTLTAEVQEVGSGAKIRPKREELIRMAKRREIDAILVSFSRFGLIFAAREPTSCTLCRQSPAAMLYIFLHPSQAASAGFAGRDVETRA